MTPRSPTLDTRPSTTFSPVQWRQEAAFLATLEHTLLKSSATPQDILTLCQEAHQYGFKGICVQPIALEEAVTELHRLKSSVVPIAVVGFPLGSTLVESVCFETHRCIELGAQEIDMVLPLHWVKAGADARAEAYITQIIQTAGTIPVKVILETALLQDEEKIRGALLAERAGAQYIKTCTGFQGGSATVEDVALLRKILRPQTKIKASAGIRNLSLSIQLLEAGANCIGTSATVAIVREYYDLLRTS